MKPKVIEYINHAYNQRRKNVTLLTGNVLDIFWCSTRKRFMGLEQLLYDSLHKKMTVLRLDAASGVSFYRDDDGAQLENLCEILDKHFKDVERLGDIRAKFAKFQTPLV